MNSNEITGQQVEVPSPDTENQGPAHQLRAMVEEINLALNLDEEILTKISQQVKDGFEYDYTSRCEWERNLDDWTNLALQVREEKTWPWRNASNVKYPLLSTASMQFNARAYPSLVPSTGDIVKVEVIGKDPTGGKLEKAKRIGSYMSYQILKKMDGWEEDMDKLLMMLPIVGTVFKKTYYNSIEKKNVSKLVLPKNLVVNYWATSLENAERISEIIEMTPRVVKSRMMSKMFRDIELGDPQTMYLDSSKGNTPVGKQDGTIPYQIVEQHTYFDLDDDGYPEPYVITFERASGEILRISARFDDSGISVDDEGNLQEIRPINYYTKFSFIPNPDGGFYDIGFGLLLGPLNEAVSTLINQIVDSGTIHNLQAGFLGKGLKLKMGEQRFQPGEWKTVQSTADDLRKQIVPLPSKEPSSVLFQLMGALVTSGKELASVAEIFTGKMPGQNTPATTTMATVEQGMKVFTAVYKRVYRALQSEFKKLFKLNALYLDPQEYEMVVDQVIMPDDFDDRAYDICPGADPTTATQSEKLLKAQGLLELLAAAGPILDPIKVIARVLEAQEQPNWEDLFSQAVQQSGQVPQQPDPKMMEMQMKSQIEQQKAQMQQQQLEFKSQLEARDQVFQQQMKQVEMAQDFKHKEIMMKLDAAESIHKQRIFQAEGVQKLQQNAQNHQQQLRQSEEINKSKIHQAKSKPTSKNGRGTK